ncbi:MAG: PrsW family intramembrane metalloprotease [Anaerolineaceae bacterium]|nr:PrsW family intramembrane metalloprotease [Anaerolineaceae bacterium]
MAFIISLIFGFVPMFIFAVIIYWFDRFEKEPKKLLGITFIWGAVVAAGVAFIFNTILGVGVFAVTGSEFASEFATSSIFAPIIEESIKGLAVLLVFLFFRNEFDSILDGIVYASVAALGFAATENTHYIYNLGYLEGGWEGLFSLVFIRVFVVAWQHPFYTSFIGIGLAISRLQKPSLIKYLAPIAGWCAAVFTHAAHNTLAGVDSSFLCIFSSMLDWSGWLAMFILILWLINHEKELLVKFLLSEAEAGVITERQYQNAISPSLKTSSQLRALLSGNFKKLNAFYQICGEMVHKKYQLSKMGNEDGNLKKIDQLRKELHNLSTSI